MGWTLVQPGHARQRTRLHLRRPATLGREAQAIEIDVERRQRVVEIFDRILFERAIQRIVFVVGELVAALAEAVLLVELDLGVLVIRVLGDRVVVRLVEFVVVEFVFESIELCFDYQHAISAFHDRVIERNAGQLAELVAQLHLECSGCRQLRNKRCELRRVTIEFRQHRWNRPDKHPGVPAEMSLPDE